MSVSEKELEERERRLQEEIAKNFARVRDVERELASLQNQLHVNVAPKRHGLEMLRRKIEAQTEKVEEAQRANDAALREAAHTAEALAAALKEKEDLCQELTLLVTQSASSQSNKLAELTERMKMLNAGLALADHEIAPPEVAGAPGGQTQAAAATRDARDERQDPKAAAADKAAAAAAEAEAARARHVQIPGRSQRLRTPVHPQRQSAVPAREARDAQGTFRGFE